MGDLNGQISGPRNSAKECKRSNELALFLELTRTVSLMVQTQCNGPDFSFNSYENGPKTLIDHILIPEPMLDTVESCGVLKCDQVNRGISINHSPHKPVTAMLNLIPLLKESPRIHSRRINWKKLDASQIQEKYENVLTMMLNDRVNIDIETEKDLCMFYAKLVSCMKECASNNLPCTTFNPHLKPFWKKENLDKLHECMREKRKVWIRAGKPRDHSNPSFHEYKQAKRQFRCKMRQSVRQEERNFFQEIDMFSEVDQNRFWSLINSKRKRKGSKVVEIKVGQKTYRGTEEVLEAWEEHFTQLYSSDEDNSEKTDHDLSVKYDFLGFLNNSKNDIDEIMHEPITESEVQDELKSLKCGKAGGIDTLTNEHIKYGGKALCYNLCCLFNAMYNL